MTADDATGREALLGECGRITSVDPLSGKVWAHIYSKTDEFSKVTAKQLAASQVQDEPQ